jgi:hypothetical protein
MSDTTNTQTEDEKKAAAEAKKAEREAAKAAKAEQAAAAKAQREAEAAEKKAAKQAEVEAKKAEKEAAKASKEAEKQAKKDEAEAKKQAKIQAAEEAKAAKEANRQPEQNGVRRPGPEGKCGRVWAIADRLSAALGQPVPVADVLVEAEAEGLSASNTRCEYARWKKFNGLSGRITKPAAEGATASS